MRPPRPRNRSGSATRRRASGWSGQAPRGLLFPRVVGRDLRIGPALDPQDDLVAPGVAEGVVEAVEFLPLVVGPEHRRAPVGRALQDILVRLAVADQDPDSRLAPL